MRITRFTVIVAVVAIVLAGCRTSDAGHAATSSPTPTTVTAPDNGIAGLPAAAIAARAARAVTANSSVHVKGVLSGDGQAVAFDVFRSNLTDGRCTLTGNGQTVNVIRVGGNDYAKASASYWTMYGLPVLNSSTAANRADGKYIRATTASLKLVRLTKCVDLPRIVWDELGEKPEVVKGGTGIVNGVPTVAIISSELGTVYIATTGEPYVIRVVAPGGVSTGAWDFSDYGTPVEVDAPSADQVVDITALTASGG